MAGEAPNTPPQLAPPAITPSQAAESAAAAVVAERQIAAEKALADSLDIRDPGQPAPAPTTDGQEQGPKRKAETIPGASPDGGLTDELLDRAYAAGFSEDEAREYPAAILEKTLTRLERLAAPSPQQQPSWQEQQAWQQRQRWEQEQQQRQQWEQQQAQLPQLPQLDPAEFDERLIGVLQHRDAYYQQMFAQQQQIIAQQQQAFQQQHAQMAQARQIESRQRLHDMLTKDEDFKDLFGQRSFEEIDGTRAHAVGMRIARRMDSIANEYRGARQAQPPYAQLYEEAKQSLFSGRSQERVERQLAERTRNSAGQFVSRPTATHRNGDLPPGTDKAVASVERLLREQGRR